MKPLTTFLAFLGLILSSTLTAAPSPVGDWLGKLDVGPMTLRLALHVSQSADGTLTATFDSLDQNVTGIRIDKISLENNSLSFAITPIGASYQGTLDNSENSISGHWSQGGGSRALTFTRTEGPVSLNRPQDPKAPFPYTASEVSIENKTDGIKLSGTLIVPDGNGPFPAVVFVSGSGQQDRDESLMGHRPFLVIADHLARHGIASLRYDDRGFAKSEGKHFASTVQQFSTDALSALEFLSCTQNIDTRCIGIIGHSEGGLIAPMLAQSSNLPKFLVLLAPAVEPLPQLLARQSSDTQVAMGIPADLTARAQKRFLEDIKLIADPDLSTSQLQAALQKRWLATKTEFTPEQLATLQLSDAAVAQNIQLVSTNWFRSLVRIDPSQYLKNLSLPTLALFGEKDLQVSATASAPLLESYLQTAKNPHAHIETLPNLNHLFQHSQTGLMNEYNTIEETFAPSALETITDWILAQPPQS